MRTVNEVRIRGKGWAARSILLVLLATALGACDGQWVGTTAQFERTFEFTFDGTGTITEIATLFRDDIEGDLDIPDDSFLDAVDIQRVRLTLSPGAGNEATAATLRLLYQAQGFSGDVDITVADLAGDPIDDLVANALRAVEADLVAMLGNEPGAPSQVTMEGQVFNIDQAGSRLVLDALVEVTFSATYFTCVELGFWGFGGTAECITSGSLVGV